MESKKEKKRGKEEKRGERRLFESEMAGLPD